MKGGGVGNENETRIMQVSDIRCKGRIVERSIPRGAGPLANRHPRFPESNVNYLLLCSRNGDLSLTFLQIRFSLPSFYFSLSLSFVRKCQVAIRKCVQRRGGSDKGKYCRSIKFEVERKRGDEKDSRIFILYNDHYRMENIEPNITKYFQYRKN